MEPHRIQSLPETFDQLPDSDVHAILGRRNHTHILLVHGILALHTSARRLNLDGAHLDCARRLGTTSLCPPCALPSMMPNCAAHPATTIGASQPLACHRQGVPCPRRSCSPPSNVTMFGTAATSTTGMCTYFDMSSLRNGSRPTSTLKLSKVQSPFSYTSRMLPHPWRHTVIPAVASLYHALAQGLVVHTVLIHLLGSGHRLFLHRLHGDLLPLHFHFLPFPTPLLDHLIPLGLLLGDLFLQGVDRLHLRYDHLLQARNLHDQVPLLTLNVSLLLGLHRGLLIQNVGGHIFNIVRAQLLAHDAWALSSRPGRHRTGLLGRIRSLPQELHNHIANGHLDQVAEDLLHEFHKRPDLCPQLLELFLLQVAGDLGDTLCLAVIVNQLRRLILLLLLLLNTTVTRALLIALSAKRIIRG
mmetsp:Transcript_82305/g.207095  ORF Transcript_82305/g.207095 Transcript_82305/m.207095 type:complete len:414 (-) Transcript_82305:225-1466(-)